MYTITKLGWVTALRKRVDTLAVFPVPKLSPNLVSILSAVVTLLIYFWPENLLWASAIVLLSMLLDWIDGLIARRYNLCTRRGYLVDSICDRVSEGILASVFFFPWFYLFVINSIMTGISWRTEIHFVLPLRLLFLLAVLLKLFGYDFGFTN